MRQILGGLLFTGGLISFWWALMLNDFGEAILPGVLAFGLAAAGLALSNQSSAPKASAPAEDLAKKENNRKVAVELAASGGMIGIFARQWLEAYERDNTVPIYGVRPYWTPTGPQGAPELLTTLGMRGVEDRLRHVRETELGDPMLEIMTGGPASGRAGRCSHALGPATRIGGSQNTVRNRPRRPTHIVGEDYPPRCRG